MNIRTVVFDEVQNLRNAKFPLKGNELTPQEESYSSHDLVNLASAITNKLNEMLSDMILNPMLIASKRPYENG